MNADDDEGERMQIFTLWQTCAYKWLRITGLSTVTERLIATVSALREVLKFAMMLGGHMSRRNSYHASQYAVHSDVQCRNIWKHWK